MARVAKFLAKPAPRIKRRASGVMMIYMKRRPKVSLKGADITGPNARPYTYKVNGRSDRVVLV
jgi:hypothetical protein